jgi:hypothetical protein
VPYAPPAAGYRITVPEGWARSETAGTAVFSDKYNEIRITSGPTPAAPTIADGQAELTRIGSTATGFVPGTVTTVTRSAGSGILILYQADSPANAVTGKVVVQSVEQYEFWKNGTLVTVTLSGPVGSDNVDPWRTVTDSLRWTS